MKLNIYIILLTVFCSCTQQSEDATKGGLTQNESGRHSGARNEYGVKDSVLVEDLFKKCDSLNNNYNSDSALFLANKALFISQKTGYRKGLAGANYRLGETFLLLGKLTEGIKAIDEAFPYYIETNNQERLANLHSMRGNAYTDLGKKPEALNEYLAALKFYEGIGDKYGIANCHGNLGNINADMGRNSEAIREYETVIELSMEMGNKRLEDMTRNNLGAIYISQNNLPEALNQHQISLKLKQEAGDKRGQGIAYDNIGSVYSMMGNCTEALKLHLIALKLSEETGDKDNEALVLANIGGAKIKLGQAREAREWITRGLLLAKELGTKETIAQCYNSLYEADSALGNFKGAFEYNKIYNAYRDSLVNEENIEKTLESKIQYDFDKKQAVSKAAQEKKDAIAEKELQKQKLVRNIFVGGFAVVFLFALIFFRQRNKISKARKRSDELLLNILPEEVAEELKAKGSAEAKHFDEVTVLFTDFQGFTQLSEKLTPTELITEINECFSAFDHIMQKYGVEKIKTIGDAYMAVGGLPVSNQTHAEGVVRAALDIQQFMHEHKLKKQSEGKLFFEIRIGIHTGPVVAGIVGVKKFAYDIWGDTVNIAARMESSGEAGKINISGSTYELVKSKFRCIHRGKIQAKGKGEIDMYFMEGKI